MADKAADYGMSPPIALVATCTLNQWALDFEGNKRRILESVKVSKEKGCKYRLGPELEISGYDCEDHFYELDTIKFSWKVLGEILKDKETHGILCDYSMPVLHNGVRYNCRIFCLNNKILLIRPKMWMADDGNYREERWFTPWSKDKIEVLEEYVLSDEMEEITGQRTVPFGVAIIEAVDATIASEVCEELFTPESPNIMWGLEGVDIISNGSASHWQMGKRKHRHSLIGGATSRNGGVYMYSNMVGCDGNRLVFDGNSMIYKNGKLLATGDHLTFHEVEVVTASINLDDIRAYRSAIVSRGIQADRRAVKAPRIMIDDYVPGFRLTSSESKSYNETKSIEIPIIDEYEEMGLGISRYMWDYLCRSGAGGFFLPLSGGVDSGSTSLFVYFMCNKIIEIVNSEPTDSDEERLWKFVNSSLNKLILGSRGQRVGYAKYTKEEPGRNTINTEQLMNILLHTCNMPTSNNSPEIRKQASDLAACLGSYHLTTPIENPFSAAKNMAKDVQFGTTVDQAAVNAEKASMPPSKMMEIPRYRSSGGDYQENLAIQNIQARLRMVTAYYMAQILPLHRWNQDYGGLEEGEWNSYYADKNRVLGEVKSEKQTFVDKLSDTSRETHNKIIAKRGGSPFLLVLASSNSDEALRGFFTKYDAGSADLNPIGSFSKTELRKFMTWFADEKFQGKFEPIDRILAVTASPELTPGTPGGAVQDDEVDIEMTYTDLYELGILRKRENLGPYSMFLRLCKDRLGKKMEFIDTAAKTKVMVDATSANLAELIRRFFSWYGRNRSKMTILTPGIHATNYSPDDNRFDQRPFLYPDFSTSYQMKLIEMVVKGMPEPVETAATVATLANTSPRANTATAGANSTPLDGLEANAPVAAAAPSNLMAAPPTSVETPLDALKANASAKAANSQGGRRRNKFTKRANKKRGTIKK